MNKIIHGIEVDNENYIALFNMFLENSKTKNDAHKKELGVLEAACKQIKDKNGKLKDVSCNLYDVLGSNPKASDILKVKNILEMVFGEETYKDSFVVGQLKHGMAMMPGYNLNLPKSNEELVQLIITYGKIIDSKKIDNDTIMKYGIIMKNIQSRIAEFAKNTYLLFEGVVFTNIPLILLMLVFNRTLSGAVFALVNITTIFIALKLYRIGLHFYLFKLKKTKNVLIVGTGKNAKIIADEIINKKALKMQVVGLVEDYTVEDIIEDKKYQVFKQPLDIAQIIEEKQVDIVIISTKQRMEEKSIFMLISAAWKTWKMY